MAYIEVDAELCKACELCIDVCPKGIIGVGASYNSKGNHFAEQSDAEKCTGCSLCGVMCPDAAISVYR